MGHEAIQTLVADGGSVSVIGRQMPENQRQKTANTHFFMADLLDREKLSKTLGEIVNTRGKLNNLIFFQRFRGNGDQWIGEIETSLTATKNVIEELANHFTKNGDKSIIVVGSIGAQTILDEQPVGYHVAKAGLLQMVRYYALSLGHLGIRVNSVSPSTIMKERSKEYYLVRPDLKELYDSVNPLGRMGTAQDIADAIAFLCSPKASFITGQDLVVDGGASLRSPESLARRVSSVIGPERMHHQ